MTLHGGNPQCAYTKKTAHEAKLVVDHIVPRSHSYQLYKTAKGLNVIDPKTGKPAQTPQRFVNRQIVKKTHARINNLLNTASRTRPTVNGTQNVPSLDEVKNIREFTFRLEGDTPELRKAVEGGLNQLRTEFPDFRFNAQFGGK